jgi:hypothetical protein
LPACLATNACRTLPQAFFLTVVLDVAQNSMETHWLTNHQRGYTKRARRSLPHPYNNRKMR